MNRGFKIVPRLIWETQIHSQGFFSGYGNDLKFIHLSTREQIKDTLNKLLKDPDYMNQELCLNLDLLNVKWEKAKNGQTYPHVYGIIKPEHVVWYICGYV